MAKKRGVIGWIGCGCISLVLLCSGVGVAGFMFVTGLLRNSEPYQIALKRAQADSHVQILLGTPVAAGMLVSGSVSVSGSQGNADLSIPIHGPKGSATLYVRAHRETGLWAYDAIKVVKDHEEELDLLDRD